MKCLKVFLMFVVLMALATTLLATPTEEEVLIDATDEEEDAQIETFDVPMPESEEVLPTSLRGTGRFLAQTRRVTMTCNKYPRVCRAKGSPGPDCCKKKCVNVKTDRLNCGICGKKCKYSEICCKGLCVNPLSNKKHCGGCNTKCKKGSSCVYGMCSYA
ncbi:stigma-specific STIG1-like protein 1 [Cornus florida]|uniref:stigma-specific STIG1-like protein 1 n=1 Tax=Cornus florida TaxID=4283 RepID=UPI00289F943A|nr:stigma-specific STIG1-like protein 1 [Cornus florida]